MSSERAFIDILIAMHPAATPWRRRPLALVAVVAIAFAVGAEARELSASSGSGKVADDTGSALLVTSTRPPHEYRNREQLDQPPPLQLPDISHVADKFRDKAKYGHLVAMLDVWKPALLGGGTAAGYRVTKGTCE